MVKTGVDHGGFTCRRFFRREAARGKGALQPASEEKLKTWVRFPLLSDLKVATKPVSIFLI